MSMYPLCMNHPTGRERRILKKIESGEQLNQDELIYIQKRKETKSTKKK